jgi:hypothetical protein
MTLRAVVVGRGRCKHDHSVAGAHLAMREPSVRRLETCRFAKTKGAGKPLQGPDAVLVRDHRDNRWCAPCPVTPLVGRTTLARRCRPFSGWSTLPSNGRFLICRTALPGGRCISRSGWAHR